MKKYLRGIFSIVFFGFLLFATAERACATHSMGADLTYRCVGANTYEITLSFYRDCVGIAADDSAYIDASSSCQGLYYVYLLRVPGTGQEITPICPSALSTCNGGTFTGIQEYVFKRTVILPGVCSDWTFSYNQCCRNNAITNITTPGSWQMYVYATLNNTINPCNNSPTFSNKPVPFVCLGQQFCFNHGAYDIDGDSLVYSLITPWDSPGLPIVYLPPFSASYPLSSNPAVTFNPMTGDICMTPTAMEVTVMAVLVQEYRNGVLIGSVERDIQVTVITCTNQVPALSGMNGTNNFSQTVCAGNQLCFSINSTDADAAQNTFVTWDNSIPGASFVVAAGNRQSATFCWTPSVADINSSPHCFTATVHDDNCPVYGSQTFSYCITVEGLEVTVPNQTVGCGGTAVLNATATGGSGAYTYAWSTGASTQSITVGAGSYNVTASDGICSATTTATITQSAGVNSSVVSTDVSCSGGNNGSATVTGSGGTPPFTYSWSPVGGTGTTASNLSAGSYTVTVTDAMGCSSTSSVTISEPAQLSASTNVTAVLCNGGSNGNATVIASNGTPGYTYSWSPSGGSGTTASGLSAGNYTVTVTDANGCATTANATVTEPTALTASANATPALCNGSADGTASVAANNGTPGYTYSWSPSGGSGTTANGLSAGSYTVTVTDANGCTTTANATVTEPTALTASANATPALCNGSADGTASVAANDGTPGYTYSWSPSGGTGANASSLSAGNYTVTVTDANGCTTTANTTVTEPTLLVTNASASPALCNGSADGTATAVASDGTPGYTYSWAPSGGNSANASGLLAGNYTVTVTDANGCITTANATVTEPTLLTAAASATPVLCNGGSDGSASVVAGDGTPGYTYSWSSGGAAAQENSLAAGTYTVTVTDANGCVTTATTSVTEPTALTASSSSTAVLCNGGADGSATVVAADGTPGYSYSWSPSGGNGATANGLAAGNYTVTVTDANGCTTASNIAVTEPTQLVASAGSTPALCNGSADGTADVIAADGTPGYIYSWSPSGGNAATASGLAAGNYTVTVTDANGCTVSASATVTEPLLLTASASSIPVLCNAGNDGSASVIAYDGTPGYSYAWSSGGTNSNEANLAAGNYTVVVTDANGCTTTATVTVTEPTQLTASASSNAVLCNGGSDGSASVIANDGTPGYSYSWSSGGSGSTENSLAAGTYTVTVTDANGCVITASATVTEPTALAAITSSSPVLCNGGADGSASVTASDGTPGYSYAWSSGGSGSTENSLPAGTYTVTITDANGCVLVMTETVSEPTLLTTSASSTPALCFGSADGTATVVAADGTPGYSYSWSSGGTNATEGNLPAGVYVVIVTDANGCTSAANTVVNEPTQLTATTTSVPVLCNGGSDGSAAVAANDGTPGYTYSWSSGGTGSQENLLSAGTYTVIVTDANGCTLSVNSTVTEPALLVPSTSSASCLCNGSSDGSVSVNVVGGVGNYTFLWSPGGAASATVNNIPAGSYTVTVNDSNGCSATANVVVAEPSALSWTLSSSPALCNGDSSGSVNVNVSGGTASYSYSWFPSGATSATSSNLFAGNYTVAITDANGCTATDSVTVTEPVAISLSTATMPATCGSSNGSASVNASGGAGAYQYAWFPSGGSSSSAANIPAGAYTVVVTDANGCEGTAIANVLNTGGPSVAATILSPVSCNGGSDGSASVNVSNGTAPFTYAWSPSGGTASTATGLAAGNYAVTVTDANGCISSDNVTVTEPAPVIAQAVTTSTLCFGSADGSASVNAAGGTAPYSYSWAPGGILTSTAINLAAGNYTVTVTDANGCTTSAAAVVQQPSPLTLAMSSTPALCNGAASGNAAVAVTGGTGGYSYAWTPCNASTQNAGNLHAGSYMVTVTDAHGCMSTASVNVTEPPPINLTTSSTPAICGASNGSASVNAGGGAAPYSYLWSPAGGTSATAPNLPAGSFTVLVTDANGCTETDQVSVSNAGGPVATASVTSNVTCYGGNDGSASVNITSGNPPFTYVWSPAGGYGLQASGLTAGNYSIIISDVNGCITVANISITEPPEIIAAVTSTPATCGDSNGSAAVVASGGTGSLSYLWSPAGGTSANASGLPGGSYSVVITDGSGCTNTVTTIVTNSGGAVASLQSSSDVTCNGGSNGSAVVSVNGAGPFTYLWSPTGDTTAIASNLSAGNYSVVVSDSVGCTSSVNVLITEPPAINMVMSMTPAGCNGAADGSASVQLSGGTGPFTYAWSPVAGSDSLLQNIAAGIYIIAVTDHNGCTDTAAVTVTSPSSVTLNISSTDVTCFGNADGSVAVVTTGGTAPFTYSWSPGGGTSSTMQNLPPGNYQVTVIDSSGCMSAMTASVTQPPQLALTVSPGLTLCVDQITTIWAAASGGTQPYAYVWDNNVTTDSQLVAPAATTTYSVELVDANGCTLPAQAVTVIMNPPLNLTATATPEICANESAVISSVAGGGNGGPYTYSWNNGSILTSGATVFPVADSVFTVTVSDGCSPPVQESVMIQVNPVPAIDFTPQLIEGCMPVDAAFTNHGFVPAGSVYSWNLGDGTFSSESNISHVYENPGHYTVSLQVTSPEGCTDQLTVVNAVNVFGLPAASFAMSSQELSILTPSVDFTDGSTDVVYWSWDFGDNTTSTDVNPAHTYADTGMYTIQLIVENAAGCLDTTYGVVRIKGDFTVFIPNAFTPNNDNTNDAFMAHGIGWKDFELFIIDRWGIEIFHSTSKERPWNGTYYDNRKCQSDVYEYIIRIHDEGGTLHKFLGHVTLVN